MEACDEDDPIRNTTVFGPWDDQFEEDTRAWRGLAPASPDEVSAIWRSGPERGVRL